MEEVNGSNPFRSTKRFIDLLFSYSLKAILPGSNFYNLDALQGLAVHGILVAVATLRPVLNKPVATVPHTGATKE